MNELFQLGLFDGDEPAINECTNRGGKYTAKVETPIYEPKNRCPHILELVDCEKSKRLIMQIERSSVDEREKKFLIEAAHRHSVFNYSNIADYYAHASKDMQDLMEKSALVIIDYDKSIEYGFTKLQEGVKKEWVKNQYLKKMNNEK